MPVKIEDLREPATCRFADLKPGEWFFWKIADPYVHRGLCVRTNADDSGMRRYVHIQDGVIGYIQQNSPTAQGEVQRVKCVIRITENLP